MNTAAPQLPPNSDWQGSGSDPRAPPPEQPWIDTRTNDERQRSRDQQYWGPASPSSPQGGIEQEKQAFSSFQGRSTQGGSASSSFQGGPEQGNPASSSFQGDMTQGKPASSSFQGGPTQGIPASSSFQGGPIQGSTASPSFQGRPQQVYSQNGIPPPPPSVTQQWQDAVSLGTGGERQIIPSEGRDVATIRLCSPILTMLF
jgi:hypothetical protein